MTVFDLLVLYALAGLATGLAFVTFGIGKVLPHAATATVCARLCWLPGAAILWPYILLRWFNSPGVR